MLQVSRGWLLLALACAGSGEPAASSAVNTAAVPSGLDRDFRAIEAVGQGLELSLPDASGWRHDPRERSSWVARHASTGSLLLARSWKGDGSVRAEDCERQMRLWRPELPVIGEDERVDARRVTLDGGYASELRVGLRAPAAADEAWLGQALLFGSDGRSCVCLAFSTAAQGEGAPIVVGERLGVMSTRVFERARRLDIDARVEVPRP